MKKSKGSALVDYILPTALIGVIAGLSLFGLSQNNLLQRFLSNSLNGSFDKSTGQLIIGKSSKETTSVPVSLNSQQQILSPSNIGTTNIPLGDFNLTGVPADLGELIETAGSAGATKTLADLLTQMADQLANTGDITQAEEVKKLATIGHNIAVVEKQIEEKVLACNKNKACLTTLMQQTPEKPTDFDETYYPYTGYSYYNLKHHVEVGLITDPDFAITTDMANSSAYKLKEQYETVMNGQLPQNTKNVIQQLYKHIGMIGETFQIGIEQASYGDQGFESHDPLTGLSSSDPNVPDDPLDIFEGYKSSTYTHFDSALICAAGQLPDNGQKCD